MAAAVCKFVGARHVVITDINDNRLKLAKQLGIQHTINTTKENLSDLMQKLSIREGFDIGLEMSGSEIALNTMIDHMTHGGRIALLGILKNDSRVDWNKIILNYS